jgi:negative regulator of sigma E activity
MTMKDQVKHMSESVNEQLSALLDGHVQATELDLLLARLDRDEPSRQRLARYALIGSILRDERQVGSVDLAGRVRAALETESPVSSKTAGSGRRDRARAAWSSAAAAAMVAGLGVVLAPLWLPRSAETPASRVASLAKPAAAAPVRVAANLDASASSVRRAMKPKHLLAKNSPIPADRLATYVASHGAYAASFSQSAWDTRVVNGELERVSWQAESPPDAL